MKMYLSSLYVFMVLVVLWYFSEYGQTVTQHFLFLLCCLSTPLLLKNIGQENGTQTDEVAEENTLQQNVADEAFDSSDGGSIQQIDTNSEISLDQQYPNVKRSLRQVFECAYSQLVLPWYCVPESSDSQPLHHVLSKEFDLTMDQFIKRARDFDLCEAVVCSVRVLTQHLHNAKQTEREALFTSGAEEMAVLRVFSEALVRNLFPQSLWGLDVNRCALNEIVALKVLKLLVCWLSDPDNLNQLVVSQLATVTPKSSVEDLCDSDCEGSSSASQEESEESEGVEGEQNTEVNSERFEEMGNSNSPRAKIKKRSKKLKEGWSKFVDKVKYKKKKKKRKKKLKLMEQELILRAMTCHLDPTNEENSCDREGSTLRQQDSDNEEVNLQNYMASVQEDMMEFKLSYEMWRVGHWTVSIPHVDRVKEELIFTVHLEERDNPENLNWDIKKNHLQLLYFRNRWQESSRFPSISVLESLDDQGGGDVVIEEARASVEIFLQELVSDEMIGSTQPVFQFLCPLAKLLNEEENSGNVWGLLSGLAFLLTPGQEEEEPNSPNVDATMKTSDSSGEKTTASRWSRRGGVSGASENIVPAITISESGLPTGPSEEHPEDNSQESVPNNENSKNTEDRNESPFTPITSHLKVIIKGLSRSRSQESLSARGSEDEDPRGQQNGALSEDGTYGPSRRYFVARPNRKGLRLSGGLNKVKGRDDSTSKEDSLQRNQASCEHLEATKAIFELLKEISGNSILLNIFDAILKPVMPILKKKVNSFLSKMNPTEIQMAAYIDNLRDKQWPEGIPPLPTASRTTEEKQETRERAHQLINAKYSNYLILKKNDVENVFRLFQDSEENKKLVYMLLSLFLREFLPHEDALNVSAIALQRVNNCAS